MATATATEPAAKPVATEEERLYAAFPGVLLRFEFQVTALFE